MYAHPRNLDDARLRKLAAKGVVRVNSYPGYLIDTEATAERKAAEESLEKELGGWDGMTMAQGKALAVKMKALDEKYPVHKATLDDFFEHLQHLLDVAGPEHVGIGMDWDGGGGVEGMQSVADLPKITAWLLRKGYSEQQIAGIWAATCCG
jgi:membrane dipeptidase